MITREFKEHIEILPEEMAAEFCDMSDEWQARFFNEIGRIVRIEWKIPFAFQVQHIIDNEVLNDDGKRILKIIEEYAEEI
jgi:hypothetical protein